MKEEQRLLNQEIKAVEEKLAVLKKKELILKSDNLEESDESNKYLNNEKIQKHKIKLEENEPIIEEKEALSHIGSWIYYFEDRLLEWSDEAFKIFECPKDYEGRLVDFYMLSIDANTAARIPDMKKVFSGPNENAIMNQTIITHNNNKKILSFSSNPIYSDSCEMIAIKGHVKDLTDKVIGLNGLDNFFDLSFDLHCIVSKDTYFVKISPAWSELLEYSEKELLSRSYLELVHPDDIPETISQIGNLEETGINEEFENRYVTKSGDTVYLSWHTQIDPDTDLAYCTARDVTKARLAKEELLSDLSEKELLLREIHHRIKNNLQIISSLLSLQAGVNSEEEHLIQLYQDSQNRIKSMASIHEMFYQSEELDKIEFGRYVNKLIGDLTTSFVTRDKKIEFSLNVDTVYVNLDTAIPLGLIINEVVTNSIKHGGDTLGNINIFVSLDFIEEGLQLIIGDHGVNSLENTLSESAESLGVMLINSLVEQIDGQIEQLSNCEGTVYKLIFSNITNDKL